MFASHLQSALTQKDTVKIQCNRLEYTAAEIKITINDRILYL